MPRPTTTEQIAKSLDLAETFERGDFVPDETVLGPVRRAALARAMADIAMRDAVVAAVLAGTSWRAVGDVLGMSGEAARQRYGKAAADAKATSPAP